MRLRTALITAALLLPCLAVAGNQVYRWKDANGTVHFADAPPPRGTRYTVVNVDTGSSRQPAEAAAKAAAPPTADAADASQAGTYGTREMKDTPDNRAALCARLESNIKVLNSDQIVTLGSSNKPISDQQRADQLSAAQAQYQQFCSD